MSEEPGRGIVEVAESNLRSREGAGKGASLCARLFPSGPVGFRFSPRDLLAIVAATGLTAAGWPTIGALAALPMVVLGHFFLFCNVFRVRRSYELAWSGIFLLNFSAVVTRGAGDWTTILAVQTPITLLLIGLEWCSDRYHGVGAAQLSSRSSSSSSPASECGSSG